MPFLLTCHFGFLESFFLSLFFSSFFFSLVVVPPVEPVPVPAGPVPECAGLAPEVAGPVPWLNVEPGGVAPPAGLGVLRTGVGRTLFGFCVIHLKSRNLKVQQICNQFLCLGCFAV